MQFFVIDKEHVKDIKLEFERLCLNTVMILRERESSKGVQKIFLPTKVNSLPPTYFRNLPGAENLEKRIISTKKIIFL